MVLATLPVAACNRNGLDLQSSRFSTGIARVYSSQQTGLICE
ncbi:putative transposase [Pseudomonas cannabina]|uniref:Putative transposase n=1 Tax=Pseudomonas cannabina TaxID=86840 RepID=A0A3M3RA50_PSECA|nr:putative transposase [Pseudomonas cannabina]